MSRSFSVFFLFCFVVWVQPNTVPAAVLQGEGMQLPLLNVNSQLRCLSTCSSAYNTIPENAISPYITCLQQQYAPRSHVYSYYALLHYMFEGGGHTVRSFIHLFDKDRCDFICWFRLYSNIVPSRDLSRCIYILDLFILHQTDCVMFSAATHFLPSLPEGSGWKSCVPSSCCEHLAFPVTVAAFPPFAHAGFSQRLLPERHTSAADSQQGKDNNMMTQ